MRFHGIGRDRWDLPWTTLSRWLPSYGSGFFGMRNWNWNWNWSNPVFASQPSIPRGAFWKRGWLVPYLALMNRSAWFGYYNTMFVFLDCFPFISRRELGSVSLVNLDVDYVARNTLNFCLVLLWFLRSRSCLSFYLWMLSRLVLPYVSGFILAFLPKNTSMGFSLVVEWIEQLYS